MVVTYPAIFRIDEDDPKWWNVVFPDIWGGVTCGVGLEDAFYMAEDLLKCILSDYPASLFPPRTLEETRANFPEDTVIPIQADIKNFDDISKKEWNTHFKKAFKKQFLESGEKTYEILGSITNPHVSRVFLVNEKKERVDELKDIEKKREILMIFRSTVFDNIFNKEQK